MNSKLLLILPLSLALASCAAPPPQVECVEYTGERLKECIGDPKVPEVTLNTETMIVKPECVRAHDGTTVKFRIVPKGDNKAGSVEIFAKNAADNWLNGNNKADMDLIEIKIPEETGEGERAYGFRTADKCVDPRVAVEKAPD